MGNTIENTIGTATELHQDNFDFEYGCVCVLEYSTGLQKFVKTTYKTCIRLGIVDKVNSEGKVFSEVQFIYRDNEGKQHCAKYIRGKCSIEVLKMGNMSIQL